MENKLHIVHMVSSFQGGGLEHFVIRLARDQILMGHFVSIVSLHDGPLFQQAQELDIDSHVLSSNSKIKRFILCYQFFSSKPLEIIHAHNPTVLHYATIGKIVSGAKLIMTDHAQTRGIARIPSAIERRLTDRVIAVSEHTAKDSSRFGFTGEIEVIHNGVDFKPADISRESVRLNLGLDDRPLVINVAGLLPVKAQDILIHAVALLRDSGTKMMLLIAGDGPEHEKLVNLCGELDLSREWVRFLGFRSDIPDLLNASDIFALVSRNEGLPISILEAMSHGLPIVATPAGGVKELVCDGKHGIIVPFDDASKIADAIKKLIMDKTLCTYYGENGRKHAEDNFSFRTMSMKYMEVYRNLMDY
ncbi:MAG: glycosyltransferase family 1 protein [Desulfobacteraceae bacterium]|nr:MAG: glycosyltransferase family 1 protein [Desulfobacteraceae bacterium]